MFSHVSPRTPVPFGHDDAQSTVSTHADMSIYPPAIPPIYITGFGFYM